jgi:hypothetical protein
MGLAEHVARVGDMREMYARFLLETLSDVGGDERIILK